MITPGPGRTRTNSGYMTLFRWRPLLIAAVVSLSTVWVLFAVLLMAAAACAFVGIALALTAAPSGSASRAANVISIGLGLGAGPAVYLVAFFVGSLAG